MLRLIRSQNHGNSTMVRVETTVEWTWRCTAGRPKPDEGVREIELGEALADIWQACSHYQDSLGCQGGSVKVYDTWVSVVTYDGYWKVIKRFTAEGEVSRKLLAGAREAWDQRSYTRRLSDGTMETVQYRPDGSSSRTRAGAAIASGNASI